MTRAVRHVGIVVRRIDDVLPFYRDLLGLRVVKRTAEPSEFVSRLLGLKHCRLVTCKLAAPAGDALVELLEFASHPAAGGEPATLTMPGITHIALTVRDLDRLSRKLAKAGIPFVSPPLVSLDGRAKVAFCRDPAGNWLELVEECA